MNWGNVSFDWNHLRAFLVTAEEGSLSAAARALNLTQPTLSRQVTSLEDALGVTLFERVGRGLELTETGLRLLDHARRMGEAAGGFALTASGQSQAVEGKVTITATDLASAYLLPPVLSQLAETAPGITVDIVAANDVRNLMRREADIALRNAAPTEPDLIARRLKDTSAHIYGSPAYIARNGPLDTLAQVVAADWVSLGPPERMAVSLASVGLDVAPERFRYSSLNGHVLTELVRQGLGLCVLPRDLAERVTDLVQVYPAHPAIPVPFWIITHRELRTNQRIRLVWDALVRALG